MSLTSTPPAFCRDQMGFAPRTREDLIRIIQPRRNEFGGGIRSTRYKELVSRWDKAPKVKPGLLMREQMGWPATITK